MSDTKKTIDVDTFMEGVEKFEAMLRDKNVAITPKQFVYFCKRAVAYQLNTPECYAEAMRYYNEVLRKTVANTLKGGDENALRKETLPNAFDGENKSIDSEES